MEVDCNGWQTTIFLVADKIYMNDSAKQNLVARHYPWFKLSILRSRIKISVLNFFNAFTLLISLLKC